MSANNYTYKGATFNSIVASGASIYNAKYTHGNAATKTALTYSTTTWLPETINPTAGDITSAYAVAGTPAPTNMRTASYAYYNTAGDFTATAPTWARSFKCLVRSRRGNTGNKYESNQGGQRGPNTGQAGHVGIEVRGNTYTPIGSQRDISVKIVQADNGYNGAYQANYSVFANNGGKGQDVDEGHVPQGSSWVAGTAGPHANWGTSGMNAGVNADVRGEYNQEVVVYWFS
jgi:hypothetical protein